MPCPFFEPGFVVLRPENRNARLPLIEEYDGRCLAVEGGIAAPPDRRARCCNQGYSAGSCEHFPSWETRSALRYSVTQQTADTVDLICIEEQLFEPLHWRSLRYLIKEDALAESVTEVAIEAQALAFCRSLLKRSTKS